MHKERIIMIGTSGGANKEDLIGTALCGADWERRKKQVPGLTVPGTKDVNGTQERLRELAGDRHKFVP